VVRQLYIILLALHPARFRYRFAFEMLAIFDEASAHGSRLPLLADGVRSLIRQWVHPYRPEPAATVTAGAGAPVFHSLDTPLPGRRYLLTAATLTLVLFSVLTTMIGRERWRPRIQPGPVPARLHGLVLNWHETKPLRWNLEVKVRPAPPERVDPPYGFGVLDRDGNLMLSAAEMANAPAMLRTLDRDKDGNLGPKEATPALLAVLDQDRDGIISSAEIDHSTAVLRSLDANHDGTLSLEEAYAAAEPRK
jgi:hypothetical protein